MLRINPSVYILRRSIYSPYITTKKYYVGIIMGTYCLPDIGKDVVHRQNLNAVKVAKRIFNGKAMKHRTLFLNLCDLVEFGAGRRLTSSNTFESLYRSMKNCTM